MQALEKLFNYNGIQLSVIVNEKNEPLFVAKEVCDILCILNSRDAVTRLDEDEKLMSVISTSGQKRNVTLITESGLYSLVLTSNKAEAKQFKRFVTHEVLPSIRKHGMYANQSTLDSILSDPDNAIKILTALKEEKQARHQAEEKVLQLKPKALFADAVSTSERSILIHELAKLLQQNGVNIGGNRLFQILRSQGYLCTRGEMYNLPSQKAMDLHLFEIKKTTISKPDGSVLVSSTPKVTGKGQIYFINKFIAA